MGVRIVVRAVPTYRAGASPRAVAGREPQARAASAGSDRYTNNPVSAVGTM